MTNWDDLRFLLALSEAGTFEGASESLDVDRTTVSRRIRHLERNFGTQLVERVGRVVALTDAGRDALRTAQIIEGEYINLARGVYGRDSSVSGHLRVTMAHGVAEVLAAPLALFQNLHPDVLLEVNCTTSIENLEMMESDVALRITNDPPDSLIGKRLTTTRSCWYQNRSGTIDLTNNSPLDFIQFGMETPHLVHLQSKARELKLVATTNSVSLALEFIVERPKVLAYLPCYIGDPDSRVARVVETGGQIEAPSLWLLYHSRARTQQRVVTFVDYMKKQISEYITLFDGT